MTTVKGSYPKTEHFEIVDSIGIPHPYCITHRHVAYASDHCGGVLGDYAIEKAEKHGALCGVHGCNLKYHEHQQALLVGCKVDIKAHENELRAYLIDIKDEAERNGYVGFAFLDQR